MNETSSKKILPSVCPLDCPDTCSLTASVENDRLVDVRGSDANPYTAGVICDKVSRYYPEFVHGSTRLTNPLKRVGARGEREFEAISWEEAIDRVYQGFSRSIEKYGPQSVLPFNYAGPHGELAGGSMDRRFFHKLGATLLQRPPLCGAVRGSAYTSIFGNSPGMPPEQAVEADLFVIWGNNVTVSNLHMARVIRDARRKGARVINVDPKRTKVSQQADLHLQIHPGTDVVFAMAVATELEKRDSLDKAFIDEWTVGFDAYMAQARKYTINDVENICRLTVAEFEQFIAMYLSAKNVAVSLGNGIERGRSGGSGLRAAMALQALTGNFGRRGAGVIAKPGLTAPKTTDKLQRPDLVPAGTRTFNIVDVAEHILDKKLDPPIGAIMIYNHNPVCTHPDQNRMIEALSRPGLFVAGCDVVMTDSMLYADVILPAASHFEYADIYGAYGQNYVQRADPVIPCVGKSLPNTEIFRRLAARFGFADPIFQDSDEELMDAAFDGSDPRLLGFRPRAIPLDRALEMTAADGKTPIMCKTVKPTTPSGKIELYSADLDERFGFGVPRFDPVDQKHPFVLISPSSTKRTNATFGGCEASGAMESIEVNPADAEAKRLSTGDLVRIWNDQDAVVLKVLVSDEVRPGVLYTPKGTWMRASTTGRTINALIPGGIRTDIERGACYNETFVDLEPAG